MKQPSLELESVGDETLMEQLASEQTLALPQLYARYGRVLSNVAMQVLHDPADTEEVLQDVFVQLARQPGRYIAQRGSPLTWLSTLARRRAIDKVRQRAAYHRAKSRLELQQQQAHLLPNRRRGTNDSAELTDLRHYLEALLLNLPAPQRLVIEWTFFRGMSQRQIATAARLPLGTVKTRIESGLRRLFQSTSHLRAKIA